ncbi:hypothetical protein [Candidatus Mycobacterium methanotrophicum]|uniref:Uncharacterized protein n=1 Tax=Candidatus Mycobacterium methanotrophicum TaxID=2943498 RepID=A0ABY4QIJ0_9MYCO|nr:hypothetical protein [Candidatus Mycobacterium methanotrophicum]UQX10042.1 hypothetical protein M5I08_17715 [Candidatus Mycobacterium methanotrophicum]
MNSAQRSRNRDVTVGFGADEAQRPAVMPVGGELSLDVECSAQRVLRGGRPRRRSQRGGECVVTGAAEILGRFKKARGCRPRPNRWAMPMSFGGQSR